MKGKVMIVTGASAGMGREITLQLARSGAIVVMVCRDAGRGAVALDTVRSGSGNDTVELMLADLSSQRSIRALAHDFIRTHDRLDVLVNNAGVTLPRRTETEDGIETVQNSFGAVCSRPNNACHSRSEDRRYMRYRLPSPRATITGPPRVWDSAGASSAAQAMARLDLDDLQRRNDYKEIDAYNQTKLLNLLFTYELARRLEGTGVTANAVEPGFVKTSMKVPFPYSLFSFMRQPVEKGAWISVHAATSPALNGVNGAFLSNRGVQIRSSKASYDEDAQERLWQISAELTSGGSSSPQ